MPAKNPHAATPPAAIAPEGATEATAMAMPAAETCLDLGRAARCGFPEVVYGEGKPTATILAIVRSLVAAGQPALVTRSSPEAAAALLAAFPEARYEPLARCVRVSDHAACRGRVGIVSAGTTDAAVAAEARETAAWLGVAVDFFADVGVAGPQRLESVVPKLAEADAVVVVAGMEAALASAVAGHLGCPVFAVPTSVGYGVSLGGLVALGGMLAGCAAHVAAVNIDAGFKGGFMAGLVARRRHAEA